MSKTLWNTKEGISSDVKNGEFEVPAVAHFGMLCRPGTEVMFT